ncbi:MAG TPA: YraN family protein [Actinomycetota bacterium]|nr:YraN family protein [Actinomycetota bacterium]
MRSPDLDQRTARGRAGEGAALRVYEERGYVLVARNWRCSLGELDLVLLRRGTLVVCEVKARGGPAFGGGYEAVTWSKRRKLRQLAEAFLQQSGSHIRQVRFDVASVWLGSGRTDVEIFEDAF